MRLFADTDHRIAAALFAFSLVVYVLTMSPTINFWDCAQFVAVSHTLGIPHQPGTPLYVLVGKVFSLLPLGIGIAHKINLMSAVFSALAVSFMYLTGVRLQRNWSSEKEDPSPAWIRRSGAAIGALFLALSYTFWNNAIEAEVYALSAFTMAFGSFLAVYWWEIRDRASSATIMLLIVYLMGMAVGFHLGSILVFPGVFLLVALADRRALSLVDMVLVALVVGGFVLSTMSAPDGLVIFLIAAAVLGAAYRSITWGEKDEIEQNRWFALTGIGLFVVGLSVHIFMLIRAHHDPMINQTDPTTWDTLMSVLRREQYPPRSPFEREAPLAWQIGHLWGTSIWQTGQLAGRQVIGLIQQFTFLPANTPTFADIAVPTALWLMGIVYQIQNHWRLGVSFLATLLVNSIGLLVLLNFTDSEVRDRDYFYFGFFQFAALFLGLGAGGLLRAAWSGRRAGSQVFVRGAAAVLVLLPLLPVIMAPANHPKWYEHDRSENWIAYTYAKNILESLPPDAILATNGDNDTFPLWYLQEVEGFRTDVRVVNLSLINLPWYIKQLRDYEPSLPITWTDEQIEGRADIRFRNFTTLLVAERLPDGSVAYVRDKTMWHVVQQNKWERPIYYAITVPNQNIGMFVPYLEMEGMVYRLTPQRSDDGNPRGNSDKIWESFNEIYDFRSVRDEDGYADDSIYRDAQTAHLLRNYPAALSRVGFVSAREGNYDRAIEALEMAFRFDPTFPVTVDVLPIVYLQRNDVESALDAGRRLLPHQEHPNESLLNLGESLLKMKEDDAAVAWARELVEAAPDVVDYTQLLIRSLLFAGRTAEAEAELDAYVERTGDTSARDVFDRFLHELERLESDTLGPIEDEVGGTIRGGGE